MRMLALDLSWTTGYAIGEAGSIPAEIGVVRLKKTHEDREVAVRNLGCFLRDRMVFPPDIIVAEHWLHPSAQKSGDAVIAQMLLHGALHGIAGPYGARVELPKTDEVRLHFLGNARPGKRPEVKKMVIARAIALGYLPRGCTDDDKADAVALFDFGSAHYCRKARPFVMFGASA